MNSHNPANHPESRSQPSTNSQTESPGAGRRLPDSTEDTTTASCSETPFHLAEKLFGESRQEVLELALFSRAFQLPRDRLPLRRLGRSSDRLQEVHKLLDAIKRWEQATRTDP